MNPAHQLHDINDTANTFLLSYMYIFFVTTATGFHIPQY